MLERIHQLCVERPIVPILVFFLIMFAAFALYEELRGWFAGKGKREHKE